jgi:hypothetical protein
MLDFSEAVVGDRRQRVIFALWTVGPSKKPRMAGLEQADMQQAANSRNSVDRNDLSEAVVQQAQHATP